MNDFPKNLAGKLQKRTEENALRKLPVPHSGIDFSSNDYLGFAASDTISEMADRYLKNSGNIANGSTGSRLITGNHALYNAAEEIVANFHDAESALIFNSGYDANVGFFSSVPQKGDVVLYDEYIHASIRDGLRLGNAAAYKFANNDLEALEKLIQHCKSKSKSEIYVVTESVFSMDGDSPELLELAALSSKYKCRLVIDEAHAIGVMGNKGQGLMQSLALHSMIFARIVTFGKALGCHGAAVLGSSMLKDYLVNFARSFIYTTALPPHSLATIISAYGYLQKSDAEGIALHDIISFFTAELKRLQLHHFISSHSAIHCAVVPGNDTVKNISMLLGQNGYNVKAILWPTVPRGKERLRFCLHSYNTRSQVTEVLQLFKAVLPVQEPSF